MLFDLLRAHPCVAVRLRVRAEACLLTLAGLHDALPNCGRSLLRTRAGDVSVFHRRHFNVEIDAIEQRAGNALPVTLHLQRPATTFALQVAEVAAGTGI